MYNFLFRLIARNNLTDNEARQRIASQMSIEEKKKRAHYIINNCGDLQSTEKQIENFLALLKTKHSWFSRNNVIGFAIGCILLYHLLLIFASRH
jgi:hypothetical protein